MNTQGLHHVTAFAKDPAENLRFYTEVLGLRLVKKTVNFDDPATYHFYFGNQNGEPGTIITFFLFREAAREPWEKGRPEESISPCRKEHSRFGSAGLKKTACL